MLRSSLTRHRGPSSQKNGYQPYQVALSILMILIILPCVGRIFGCEKRSNHESREASQSILKLLETSWQGNSLNSAPSNHLWASVSTRMCPANFVAVLIWKTPGNARKVPHVWSKSSKPSTWWYLIMSVNCKNSSTCLKATNFMLHIYVFTVRNLFVSWGMVDHVQTLQAQPERRSENTACSHPRLRVRKCTRLWFLHPSACASGAICQARAALIGLHIEISDYLNNIARFSLKLP